MQTSEFLPKWTSPPGDTIVDVMSARHLSRGDLAVLIDEPLGVVDGLLDGRQPITIGLARRLQEVIGGSAAFWMMRDRQYRDDVARLRDAGLPWLHELPLLDMERFGWIHSDPPDGFEVESLLRYFAVPSVQVWRSRYAEVLVDAAFRTSPSFESTPGAMAAWLRQGERIAASMACKPWDADALRRTMPEFRALTRIRDPQLFVPKLQAVAARFGVAVVVLQAPSGCRASGAVRWLSDDKALVLLSARHLTDDHFWFTFFHECGHLLLHRETRLFLDEDGNAENVMEEDANEFAVETLIRPGDREAFARARHETFAVLRLATDIGVAPGIVVAQLQRIGLLPKSHLNRLKRRYAWSDGRLVSRGTT
ncbi:ImmA/IrrE family metallo-endopeptidase [soil metagenome]